MPAQSRLGDKSQCPADSHGCLSCAHPVIGPAISGSADVFVNNKPALRVTDKGTHAGCCGPNTWEATMGSGSVYYNSLKAHRLGDMDKHCGGVGKMVEASGDVFAGG